MSDIKVPVTAGDGSTQQLIKWRDNGDGTFTQLVIVPPGKLGTPGTGTTASNAAAIGLAAPCQSVLLTNTHATNQLLFGNSVGQVTPLSAGERVSIPATDVSQVFAKDAVGGSHATFAYQPVIAA
jgi:hypothetical protein